MTSESKTWQRLKNDYLCQVEKALASVRHPRTRDVLEDVSTHLERRLGELAPGEQTAENLRAIIAEMGPPADYAELLESERSPVRTAGRVRPTRWIALAGAAAVVVVAIAIIVALRGGAGPSDKMAAEELTAKAWKLWQQRQFGAAETLFAQAVEKDPTNANTWNGLGWAQFNQGKSVTAATSFGRCLDIKPTHPAALNGLGWIAKNDNKIDEAIDHWQRAIDALPTATAALNGLATTYMEAQRYDEAVEIYEKWLRVEPDNARVKAELERARQHKPIVDADDLPQLMAELADPQAPRFVALNQIIRIGAPAVPTLIEQMRTSNNWQIPKALGVIGDDRAVLPLIEKLETSDAPPMPAVIGEALERITGQKPGVSSQSWRDWWEANHSEGTAGPNAGEDV